MIRSDQRVPRRRAVPPLGRQCRCRTSQLSKQLADPARTLFCADKDRTSGEDRGGIGREHGGGPRRRPFKDEWCLRYMSIIALYRVSECI